MNRILILKLWALGDIVMATPMLDALRAAHPRIHITWAAEKDHAEVLRGHPAIDELLALDTGAWRRQLRRGDLIGWCATAARLRRDLRARRFDAAINCHPEKWWSALLCPAPTRVGLYPGATLPASRRFYSRAIGRSSAMHNTDHYLLATSSLGCPPAGRRLSIGEPPEEARIWEALQARCHLFPQHPLVVLAPFSTGENRNWERDRYAALADALEQHCGARVLLTFRVADRAKADDVVTHARYPLARVEGTTLREYVALIRHADLVICPDTSAMHIAAATGTPYVALFGATPVQERAPLVGGGKVLFHPLPCAPCDRPTCTHTIFRACMKQITVEEALEVCRPFLEKRHA